MVDWRTSVVDELALRAHRKLINSSERASDLPAGLSAVDWSCFAQAWRDSYVAFTRSFGSSRDASKSVDGHHRDRLVALLRDWGLKGL